MKIRSRRIDFPKRERYNLLCEQMFDKWNILLENLEN